MQSLSQFGEIVLGVFTPVLGNTQSRFRSSTASRWAGIGCSATLSRCENDLYFEPKYDEFKPRTTWSLPNAFTLVFKALEPVPQFKATAKLGEFMEARFSPSF